MTRSIASQQETTVQWRNVLLIFGALALAIVGIIIVNAQKAQQRAEEAEAAMAAQLEAEQLNAPYQACLLSAAYNLGLNDASTVELATSPLFTASLDRCRSQHLQ